MANEKLDFQKFMNKVSHEVYEALGRKYNVRNAVFTESTPGYSSQVSVILVVGSKGISAQEPCIKKFTQAYMEYDTIYNGDIKAFATGFAKEVRDFYAYVRPPKETIGY